MRVTQYVLAIVLILLLAGFFLAYVASTKNETNRVKILTSQKTISVDVEIADSPDEHARGLMYRKSMDENNGMLFIFSNEQERSFWMKNTLIPLDIIFISSNLTIVDIKDNFLPCEKDPCPTYASKSAAKYVLEVSAGFAERNNIKIDDGVRIL